MRGDIYPEEFEKLWKAETPSRLSGRKEAGYRVYCRTKTIIQEQQQAIDSLVECTREYDRLYDNHTLAKITLNNPIVKKHIKNKL